MRRQIRISFQIRFVIRQIRSVLINWLWLECCKISEAVSTFSGKFTGTHWLYLPGLHDGRACAPYMSSLAPSELSNG